MIDPLHDVEPRMETKGKKAKRVMTRDDIEREMVNLIPQKSLAVMLHVTVKTVIAWNRVGVNGRTLPKVRVGRKVYYRPDDVSRFQQWIGGGK